ncbi:ribonuclease III [Candidatus Peregrinibacteria bacterium CG_4_10_14_0_2_um_filter_43_11]|nr:MAG: ribonuclease III [Candidatus Peregrinibacteria bacterium CG_4_10_14_0_2_um_filter_43_11]
MYKKLEEKIGLHFEDWHLLRMAFVHRSYLNEHKDSELSHNERLEFLGDAILELVVTEYLYTHYPNSEGDLTNWRAALVKREMLAKVSRDLELGQYLFLSHGEEKSGGREKDYLLANTFEALIGVIYLELGYEKARDFIVKFLLVHLEDILETGSHIDAKTKFQEIVQEKVGVTPNYELIHEEGPDHNKIFSMGAYINERMVGKGSGGSKQIAEQKAAEDALERLKW